MSLFALSHVARQVRNSFPSGPVTGVNLHQIGGIFGLGSVRINYYSFCGCISDSIQSRLCTQKLSPAIYVICRGAKRKVFNVTDGGNGNNGRVDISHLFIPVPVQASNNKDNLGADMVGPLKKQDIVRILKKFYADNTIKNLSKENGLDDYLYQQTYINFRKFCIDSECLPVELHIIFSDILQGGGHIHNIYPSFMKHAQQIFPHLNCMDDLVKISDLSNPPNWYTESRTLNRKIVFHAGPTNSGKTYHALEQFINAKSGIYCGPLKLLAAEVYHKSNSRGTPCDLVTGEERRYGGTEENPAQHVACTVEMAPVNVPYDVAVIDEIQMIRDQQRGWAWTRAFLGLCAKEIHVCGEAAAIELVKELVLTTGEEQEVRRYKRLTDLTIEDRALKSLDNVMPGDCIVCFNKKHIHYVSQEVERRGHEVAVIYGGLPPGTKLAQAQKFNDPDHSCNVMVATDAIGMGMNLSIRRIIFYSLIKPWINEKGEKDMDLISVSSALQIAGRAGRYGTQFEQGFVTTFKAEDLPTLKRILSQIPDDIEKAGLHPTADQMEMFAYQLPSYTLSNLIDIFVNLCTVDSTLYFMCITDDFKFLADLIQHIPLALRTRYILCCAPINKKMPFVCSIFLKISRQMSANVPVTLTWLCLQVQWPFSPPRTILDLVHLEEVFDVFDLYLWLSYRFLELFPDGELVRGLQTELDLMIEAGVSQITVLLRNSDQETTNVAIETEDMFEMDAHRRSYRKGYPKRLENLAHDSSNNLDNATPWEQSLDKILNETEISEHVSLPLNKTNSEMQHLDSGDCTTENTEHITPGDLPVSVNQRSRGRITERLLAQGLLSPAILEQLKQEWIEQVGRKSEENRNDRSARQNTNSSRKKS